MKFLTTAAFDRDVRLLKPEHLRTFKDVVRSKFAPACDAWAAAVAAGGQFRWPASLRVSPLKGDSNVLEMTWSFSSPDGRATFQLRRQDDEWICLWRRVGDHGVYHDP